jgi:hypothetical protein
MSNVCVSGAIRRARPLPPGVGYRPVGHAASLRQRNLQAQIAVSSVVSSPSTRTAIGRALPVQVVAILDG